MSEISNNDVSFVLPEREAMLRRLIAVNDEPHFIKRFYPHILKWAGSRKVPNGVWLLWELAVHDYAKDTSPMLSMVIKMRSDDFLKAIVGDDESVQKRVIEANKTMKQQAT